MAAPGDTGVEEVILFSTLSILQLIKDAQQQHGLRHGDYQRYRAYCARKLRRVRKSLKFTNTHRSVPKHPAKFQNKKVNADVISEARYLLVPLFDAERCWAYGMQLKQELTAEEAPRKKFHMVSRMKKAVQHAGILENLCKSLPQIDAHTKLEAQAYNAWMQGCLHFETQEWQKSMEAFTGAKTIYEKLGTAVKDEALRTVYTGRCAEMQPQLRYCAYSIGGDESVMSELMEMRRTGRTGDDVITSDLDKLIAQTLKIQEGSVKAEVTWAGHTVPLVSPPKVHAFFNAQNQFEKDLPTATDFDSKMSLYEKLLIDCRDAIQALRDETKSENLKTTQRGESEEGTGELSQAQLIHSYLCYVRLSRTLDRYLLMIDQTRNGSEGKKGKPQDLIRLYDTVLQNLSDMQALPGVHTDRGLISSLETQVSCYKAYRCYFVGEAYASLKKWPESLALFDRTVERIGSAEAALKKSKNAQTNVISMPSPADMKELAAKANGAKHKAYASSLSSQSTATPNQTVYEKPLLDDLETYRNWNPSDVVSGKVAPLIQLPPDFRPMPCKPLFFDLALNHVKFPSLEKKMAAPVQQQAKSKAAEGSEDSETGPAEGQAPGGLSGMVKGWFWGGGK